MASPVFEEWCQKQGILKHEIVAGVVNHDLKWRGIFATTDLYSGSVLLEVPEKLLMTGLSARKDPLLQTVLREHGSHVSPVQVLILHLLHEVSKGKNSFWQPYLVQLPRNYTTLSMFSAKEAAEFQVPYAVTAAQAALEKVLEAWAGAREALRALEQCGMEAKWATKAAWKWADATLASRTMHLADDTAGALTPYGDLFNYEPPPGSCPPHIEGVLSSGVVPLEDVPEDPGSCGGDGYFDKESRRYKLVAKRRYAAGEEVYLCYGQYSNLELLEHYGFMLQENPNDTAKLDPASLAVPELLSSPLKVPAQDCWLHSNGGPSWGLLRQLRLATAPSHQLKARGFLAAAGERVSVQGDIDAFKLLQVACLATLHGLPTTAAQDEHLLALEPWKASCLQLAVTWRLSFKRVLEGGVEVASQAISALQGQGAQ